MRQNKGGCCTGRLPPPLLLLLLLLLGSFARALVRHPIDFGWRFHLGDPGRQDLCPGGGADPFTALNGTACSTWGHVNPHGGLSVDECRLACCGDPQCAGWLHAKGYCYIGDSNYSCAATSDAKGNVGGIRTIPAAVAMPADGGPQTAEFEDSTWRVVNIPHDYVVEQAPDESLEGNHGYRAKNISWYRRNITVPGNAAGPVFLEFDGVYRSADMWLNGRYLGHHSSGYTGFRFRVGPSTLAPLRSGLPPTMLLAIRVDPRANEGWFYEGGGIYRHAWLVMAAKSAYIAPQGVHATAVLDSRVVRPSTGFATAAATVTVVTELGGVPTGHSFEQGAYKVATSIVGPDGAVAWSGSTAVSSNLTTTQRAHLPNAALWEPPVSIHGPVALYTVVSTLKRSEVAIDAWNTSIGIREIVHDANRGVVVNGRAIKVKGMCNHQDFAGVGTAVPDRLQAFRVRSMTRYGVNAWRMSHNPPNPELLDELDRAGVLVMAETRNFGNHSTWLNDWESMIRRDRNHPSIAWWSVCNEVGCEQATSEATIAVGIVFKKLLRTLDPVRPMTAAWKGYTIGGQNKTTDVLWASRVVDVYGKNYGNGAFYDTLHNTTSGLPMIASEHCSCSSDRAQSPNSSSRLLGEFASWSCVQQCWEPVAVRPFVEGFMSWTGFDYRGENNWPETNSQFGMVDLAGFPKADAYYWASQFLPKAHAVVKLLPNTWGLEPDVVGAVRTLITARCQPGLAAQAFDFVPALTRSSTADARSCPAGHANVEFLAQDQGCHRLNTSSAAACCATCTTTLGDSCTTWAYHDLPQASGRPPRFYSCFFSALPPALKRPRTNVTSGSSATPKPPPGPPSPPPAPPPPPPPSPHPPGPAVTLRSRSNSSLCLTVAHKNPASMVGCEAGDSNQLFWWNESTGVLQWATSSTNPMDRLCLDLLGGHSGVDFYSCRPGANQEWQYSLTSGVLKPTALAAVGQCVTLMGGGLRQAWVYTNGDAAELFLNGKSRGRQSIAPFDKGTWFLTYEAGNLSVAVTKDGAPWGTDAATIADSAAATALKLSVDMPVIGNGDAPLAPDGQDVIILTATVLDAHGRVVAMCDVAKGCPVVRVDVTGPGALLGMGNGDPHDHTLEGRTGGNTRRVFSGRVRALVQSIAGNGGDIVVTASASGLTSSSATVTAGRYQASL